LRVSGAALSAQGFLGGLAETPRAALAFPEHEERGLVDAERHAFARAGIAVAFRQTTARKVFRVPVVGTGRRGVANQRASHVVALPDDGVSLSVRTVKVLVLVHGQELGGLFENLVVEKASPILHALRGYSLGGGTLLHGLRFSLEFRRVGEFTA
jgi:hypothetical protein